MSSEVKIITTKEGFRKMKDYIDENLDLTISPNLLECLDEKVEYEASEYIVFGWNSIKWNDLAFEDVKSVMRSLDYITKIGIPYRYARIGSDTDDIEMLDRGFDDNLPEFSVDVVLSYDISEKRELEEYYALYNCDELKSQSSMNMIGIFTRDELNKQIRKRLAADDMEFDDDNDYSDDNLSIYDINTLLKYGHIQSLSINEEL